MLLHHLRLIKDSGLYRDGQKSIAQCKILKYVSTITF